MLRRKLLSCVLTLSSPLAFAEPAMKSLVEKLPQTIGALTITPDTLTIDGMATISAIATSGLPVNFSPTTPLICRTMGENGRILIPQDVGVCTIVANQAGNANYQTAPTQSKTIKIDKANQTISNIQFVPNSLTVKEETTAVATASSGLPIKFVSTTPSICLIEGTAGDTVTGIAGGTCTITASQNGNAQYNSAPIKNQSITVTKREQIIGNINLSAKILAVNNTITVSAKANSGLPVVFSSETPTICSIGGFEGDTVTGIAGGTCIIAANQSGSNAYQSAPTKTKTLTVTKIGQTISNAITLTPPLTVSAVSTITATASSGLTVVFNSITPSTCAVLNNTVTGVTTGSCTIIAAQAGNEQYKPAAPKAKTVMVAKGNNIIDAISFDPPTLSIGTNTTARANSSANLPVSFSSQTNAICTTSGENGATVTGVASGNCAIAANQSGDVNWKSAASITQNITVSASPPPSCLAIKNGNASATSGVYKIDPDGVGGNAQFEVYCDMETDGGGWTLVLAYKNTGGKNKDLVLDVPRYPESSYSHMSNAAMKKLAQYNDARFYCRTSAHSRVIHFKTNNTGILAYIRDGSINSVSYWKSGFTKLDGHSAYLPDALDNIYSYQRDFAMTNFPFWKGGTYHWGIRGGGNRWECDDYSGNSYDTLHQIWVR